MNISTKRFQRVVWAFRLCNDAFRRILHKTGQIVFNRYPVNERTEADALDNAGKTVTESFLGNFIVS